MQRCEEHRFAYLGLQWFEDTPLPPVGAVAPAQPASKTISPLAKPSPAAPKPPLRPAQPAPGATAAVGNPSAVIRYVNTFFCTRCLEKRYEMTSIRKTVHQQMEAGSTPVCEEDAKRMQTGGERLDLVEELRMLRDVVVRAHTGVAARGGHDPEQRLALAGELLGGAMEASPVLRLLLRHHDEAHAVAQKESAPDLAATEPTDVPVEDSVPVQTLVLVLDGAPSQDLGVPPAENP